jgi:hypothetical protein
MWLVGRGLNSRAYRWDIRGYPHGPYLTPNRYRAIFYSDRGPYCLSHHYCKEKSLASAETTRTTNTTHLSRSQQSRCYSATAIMTMSMSIDPDSIVKPEKMPINLHLRSELGSHLSVEVRSPQLPLRSSSRLVTISMSSVVHKESSTMRSLRRRAPLSLRRIPGAMLPRIPLLLASRSCQSRNVSKLPLKISN